MALTPGNIKAGNRRAFWDTGGNELELGITVEPSTWIIEQVGEGIPGEQWGELGFADFVFGGLGLRAILFLREWSNAILLAMIEGTSESTGPTIKALQIGGYAGTLGSTVAKQLRLHPTITTDTSDESDNMVMYKAVPVLRGEPIRLSNKADGYVLPVGFVALIDTSKSAKNFLGRWKEDAA